MMVRLKMTVPFGLRCLFMLSAAAAMLPAAGNKPEEQARFLADGAEKMVVARRCSQCHAVGVFTKFRKSEEDWEKVMADMENRNADIPDADYDSIVDYLARNYGPGAKLDINRAPFEEVGKLLDLTKDEAKAVVAYREGHGPFKQLSDLLSIPGIDGKKLEARRDVLKF